MEKQIRHIEEKHEFIFLSENFTDLVKNPNCYDDKLIMTILDILSQLTEDLVDLVNNSISKFSFLIEFFLNFIENTDTELFYE